MRGRGKFVVVLLHFVLCALWVKGSALELQESIQEIFNKRKDAVVLVIGFTEHPESTPENPKYLKEICTGFFVSKDGLLVTVSDVIHKTKEIWVKHKDQFYSAVLIGKDTDTRVAFLQINGLRGSAVPFIHLSECLELPKEGAIIIPITCQLGTDPSPAMGLITGWHTRFLDQYVFRTTHLRSSIPLTGGESGAPVFDVHGRFVGMMLFKIDDGLASFILPARVILRRDDLVVSGTPSNAYLGIRFDDHVAYFSKQLVVGEVFLGSPAEKAGVQTGDILLEYNDKVVNGLSDLADALFFTRPGQYVTLKLRRENTEKVIRVIIDAKAPQELSPFPNTEVVEKSSVPGANTPHLLLPTRAEQTSEEPVLTLKKDSEKPRLWKQFDV